MPVELGHRDDALSEKCMIAILRRVIVLSLKKNKSITSVAAETSVSLTTKFESSRMTKNSLKKPSLRLLLIHGKESIPNGIRWKNRS